MTETLLNQMPILVTGQLYLCTELNDYAIVTRNNRNQISYSGRGFKGQADSEIFVERFEPVDPADVDDTDLTFLSSLCPDGTLISTGFIVD